MRDAGTRRLSSLPCGRLSKGWIISRALWERPSLDQTLRSSFQCQDPGIPALSGKGFAIPRVFFSVSSLCFRRLNDPSVVTPFSRDDRGHTPLHVAALCGMWSWVGIWGLSGQRDGAKGGPAEARLTGLGVSELAWWRGLLHGTPPGTLLEEKVADGPQA